MFEALDALIDGKARCREAAQGIDRYLRNHDMLLIALIPPVRYRHIFIIRGINRSIGELRG
jgi:hypothetical protein